MFVRVPPLLAVQEQENRVLTRKLRCALAERDPLMHELEAKASSVENGKELGLLTTPALQAQSRPLRASPASHGDTDNTSELIKTFKGADSRVDPGGADGLKQLLSMIEGARASVKKEVESVDSESEQDGAPSGRMGRPRCNAGHDLDHVTRGEGSSGAHPLLYEV